MTKLLLRLFVKDAEKIHDGRVRAAYGKLSGIVGIACNLLLAGLKLLLGQLSGSLSITADAMNNLSDAGSSVVTLVGFHLAGKPADPEHPYGHARIEYISGLIVAGMILLIGWELAKGSLEKILNPQPVVFSWVMAAALLLSMGLKLWLALFNRKLGKKIDSAALLATSSDSRNDVISTGAVLISCLVGMCTSFDPDGYMGLLVALFILYSGIKAAKETIAPLLGEAPDPALVREVRETLLAYEHVLGVHDLMVHDYGPGQRFASVHLEMDRKLDPLFSHNIIDAIERDFAREKQIQLVIHYDPVVTDDETISRARDMAEELAKSLDARLSIHDFRLVEGPLHTNLVFDLVVPHELAKEGENLKKRLCLALQEKAPDYYAVIHLDSEAFN